eukprot:645311-Lingulodinium_polyedra.AAC.1
MAGGRPQAALHPETFLSPRRSGGGARWRASPMHLTARSGFRTLEHSSAYLAKPSGARRSRSRRTARHP